MEILGGAPFMDGEWESICRILSFDQDSDLSNSISHNMSHDPQLQLPTDDNRHVNESLFGLLMGNADPFICPTQSSCSDVSNGSLVNVNVPYCHQFMQPYCNDDDQFSSLSSSNSSSLGFLARNGSFMDESVAPMINIGSTTNWMDGDDDDDDANADHSTKRKHDHHLEIQAESPILKKRTRVMNNRKMQPRKTKKEQKKQKAPTYELSDNESNGSQEVINEEAKETPNLVVKKKAIRGGATDPQSLYARKRRERINERLRTLQNLVPNGTKVDISTMLEEAVNYVKFLQLQIKLLSSDDMWMYAPLAYNGFDGDLYNSFSPHFPKP